MFSKRATLCECMLPHGRTILRRYALDVFLKAPLLKITGRYQFARFTFIRYFPIFRAGRGGAWGTVWSCVWFLPPFTYTPPPAYYLRIFLVWRGGCRGPCGANSLKQTWLNPLPTGTSVPLSGLYKVSIMGIFLFAIHYLMLNLVMISRYTFCLTMSSLALLTQIFSSASPYLVLIKRKT